jgi:hypothetical protein
LLKIYIFLAIHVGKLPGMMARPGATQVSITTAGELDYQLIYRWIQSEIGLGQGIVEKWKTGY